MPPTDVRAVTRALGLGQGPPWVWGVARDQRPAGSAAGWGCGSSRDRGRGDDSRPCGVRLEGSRAQGWPWPGWSRLGESPWAGPVPLGGGSGGGQRRGRAVIAALQSPSVDEGDSSPKHFAAHSPQGCSGSPLLEGNGYLEGFCALFPLGNGQDPVPPRWHAQLDTEPLNPQTTRPLEQSAPHRVPSLSPPPQSPGSSHVTSRLGHCVSGDRGHSSEPA